MVKIGERHVLGPQALNPQYNRQFAHKRHIREGGSIVGSNAEMMQAGKTGPKDQIEFSVSIRVEASPANNEGRRVLIPGVIIDETPSERFHGNIQPQAVLMVAEVAHRGPLRLSELIPGRVLPAVQYRLRLRIPGRSQRRIPRRAGNRITVLFKVRNPQEVERVCPKEIGHVCHPGRQPSPLVITRLQLDGLAPVHAVDDVNILTVHFSPGDLLFAQDDIKVVGAIADV